MPSDIEILGKPITFPFSKKVAPNRFLKSAMTERLCTYSKDDPLSRGQPTDEYLEMYRQWGLGKIGTIIIGNTPIDVSQLEAAGNLIIDKSLNWDVVGELKQVVEVCKAEGSIVLCQLTHGGRQTPMHINPHPKSSSDTQCPPAMGMEFGHAQAMTTEEIKDVIQRFGYGAQKLYEAGCDGAQLHGAHGYLLSQFLSPKINKRTDEYGGSFDNRSRIVFEIKDEIRRRVPDPSFMLSIKYNSQDYIEGGFDAHESQLMAARLEEAGFDLIELSGGTYESGAFEHKKESTKKREAYFIEFAENLRPHIKKSVLCVTGGFRSASRMAEAISNGACDIVGLARPLTAQPHLCAEILEGKTDKAKENMIEASKQTLASVIQIHETAEKKPLTDLSTAEGRKFMEEVFSGESKSINLADIVSGFNRPSGLAAMTQSYVEAS